MEKFIDKHKYTCGLVEAYDAMIDRIQGILVKENLGTTVLGNNTPIDEIIRKRGYLQCSFTQYGKPSFSIPIPTGSKYSNVETKLHGHFIIRGLSYAFVSMNEILPNYPLVNKFGKNIECKYRYFHNGFTYSMKIISKNDQIIIAYDDLNVSINDFFRLLTDNDRDIDSTSIKAQFVNCVNHMASKLSKNPDNIITVINSLFESKESKVNDEDEETKNVFRFNLLGNSREIVCILAIMLVRLFEAKYTDEFDDIDDEIFIRAEWASLIVETIILKTLYEKDGKLRQRNKNDLHLLTDQITSMFINNKVRNRKFQEKIGVTQELECLTPIDSLSHIRRLKVYMSEDQAPDRKREYNDKQYGYMCMFETSDSKAAGLNKALAITTLISKNEEKYASTKIEALYDLISSDPEDAYPLFENGKFIGFIADPQEFIDIVYSIKMEDEESTISAYLMNDILCYNNDEGRLVRPLKSVMCDKEMYMDIGEYYHYETEEIYENACMGMSAAMITFSNMSPGPRNAYQCSMNKQVISFNINKLDSTNHQEKLLCNPSLPFTATNFTMKYLNDWEDFRHSNVIAVIMPDKSNNDDALIINKSSVERGLFNNIKLTIERIFKHEVSTFDPKESIQVNSHKDKIKVYVRLNFEDDGYDENGTIKVGETLTNKKDMQQALDLRKINPYQTHKYVSLHDSKVYRTYVHNAKEKSSEDYSEICSSHFRTSMIGDKHATDAAQKGVIALLRDDYDMVQLPDGTIPDIQINPHGLPSRMTIGTLLNLLLGSYMFSTDKMDKKIKERLFSVNKYPNLKNYVPTNKQFYVFDSTPFKDNKEIIDILKRSGCEKTKVYNPLTKMWTRNPVSYGVLPYVSLKQQICEKSAARLTGPNIPLTGQPIKGRKKDGGSALGEMEVNALIGYSADNILHRRMFIDTDITTAHVCTSCKYLNIANYKCPICNQDTLLINVRKPFVTYCEIMAAMGFKVYYGPQ